MNFIEELHELAKAKKEELAAAKLAREKAAEEHMQELKNLLTAHNVPFEQGRFRNTLHVPYTLHPTKEAVIEIALYEGGTTLVANQRVEDGDIISALKEAVLRALS